ncbi:MAG: DUF2284 domain-containing protein [Candidatus Brocadiales bacterium]|nr:DUF2284 domain-containing protein [Candidatus Brocadiales bacterium]
MRTKIEPISVLCDEAIRLGATEAKIIPIDSVVVEPWVQLKCRFGCPHYGRSKTCPPFAPHYKETKEILGYYKYSLLVEGQPPGKDFKEMLLKLELEANIGGYHKALALGAGPCPLCTKCPEEGPCLLPYKARPSMEACGIDVFQTVRNNGLEVNFLERKGEYVKYFGLILLK